jgi:peptidoglycan/xylan/chitin deacetylase (PgdA/CDA1 family)
MYHQIVVDEPIDIHAVRIDAFESQINWLHAQGYESVTVEESFIGNSSSNSGSPSRRIAITFDDGYLDAYTNALPILAKYDFKATLFLVAKRVGIANDWDQAPGLVGAPLMDWYQINEMTDHGFLFGAHTCSHPDLTAIPTRQAEEEIRDSRRIIEEQLQKPVRGFSYPYSQYDESVVKMVSENGFHFACTYAPGYVGGGGNQRFLLQRTGILATDTLKDFIGKVESHLRWRLRKVWRDFRD